MAAIVAHLLTKQAGADPKSGAWIRIIFHAGV
jgi:hypothetical protein